MTRKYIPILLFLFAIFIMVSPTMAQTPTETYTSQDGRITMTYPQGWVIKDHDTLSLRTSENVPVTDDTFLLFGNKSLKQGEGVIYFNFFNPDSQRLYDHLFPGQTLVEKLQSLVDAEDTKANPPDHIGDAIATTIGSYSAAKAVGTIGSTGNTVELMLVDFNSQYHASIGFDVSSDSFALLEPKLLAIANSLVYAPPSAADNTPIDLKSLAPITAQNITNLKPIVTIDAFNSDASSVALSPDGQTLVAASSNGQILVWDIATGQKKTTPSIQSSGVGNILFTPDGKTLISEQSDNTIHLWDTSTGQQKTVKQSDERIWGLATRENGKEIIYGSNSLDSQENRKYHLWLWNVETDSTQMLVELPSGERLSNYVLSPDGNELLYSANANPLVLVWLYDLNGQREIGHWSGKGVPISLFFMTDSQPLLGKNPSISSYDTVEIWNPQTNSTLFSLKGYDDTVDRVFPSPDRSMLVTTISDETMRFWDAQTGDSLAVFPQQDSISDMAFSHDSRLLVTSDQIGQVYIWGVTANL